MPISVVFRKLKKIFRRIIDIIVAIFTHKAVRLTLHLLAALLFGAILLLVLPAAMPDGEWDGGGRIDNIFTSQSTPPPNILIIYPEREAWGEDEANYLAERISTAYSLTPTVISDNDYLASDEDTVAILTASPCLTITLGITDTAEGNYLDHYYRLGPSGLELTMSASRLPSKTPILDGFFSFDIFNTEEQKNTVDTSENRTEVTIMSPSRLRVREGVERFLEHFYTNGMLYRIKKTLPFSDIQSNAQLADLPTLSTETGKLSIVCFSYVDGNEYTLRAMRGIIENQKPDLVIFNGDLVGKATTRAQLSKIWDAVSALLEEYSLSYYFTVGDRSGSALGRDTVCEVISSYGNCLNPTDGDESSAFAFALTDSAGNPTALVAIGDTFGDNLAFCDLIESHYALLRRATEADIAVIAVLPALTTQVNAVLPSLSPAYTSGALTDLYDSLTYINADAIVCAASPLDVAGTGNIYLSGSIGFDSKGLGGRFDYHNGKRGAISITLEARRSAYTETTVSYIFTAELGLNER